MMKSIKTAWLGLLCAAGLSMPASAVTFNPSSPSSLNFGDVAVGSSQTLSFALSFDLDLNEEFSGRSDATFSPDFSAVATNSFNECFLGLCTYDITFAPSGTGTASDTFFGLVTVRNTVAGEFPRFDLQLTGNGVVAIPLPATLPMALGALGVFAFCGGRRRRDRTSEPA